MAKKRHTARSPYDEPRLTRRIMPIAGLAVLSVVTLLVVWLAVTRF